jgi:hypothetical protein
MVQKGNLPKNYSNINNDNPVDLEREKTVSTERPPLDGEVSAIFFADRRCHMVSMANPL